MRSMHLLQMALDVESNFAPAYHTDVTNSWGTWTWDGKTRTPSYSNGIGFRGYGYG